MRCAILLFVPAWLGTCQSTDPGPCTAWVAPSVEVTVVDASGRSYLPEGVSYAVDGGAFADCAHRGTSRYTCGYEEPGRFVVRVIDGGAVAAEETLEVRLTDDHCHVITEHLQIVL